MATDRWRELCELVEPEDHLPMWTEAGPWTAKKLHYWHRYVDITTTAMVGNQAWPGGVAYLDLFGGAGVCSLRRSGRRIPGSVLIAAYASRPFSRIIACEANRKLAKACEARLAKTVETGKYGVVPGDCNELVGDIIAAIPTNALTLVFVDPKGLDAKFDTIAEISRRRRADFAILFADAYDIPRNIESRYRRDPQSKLDQVLGPDSNWREKLDALSNPTGLNKRRLFGEIYQDQLRRHLGYTHFRRVPIECGRGPLYSLVYASKHKLGLKFWDAALMKDVDGQMELFGS